MSLSNVKVGDLVVAANLGVGTVTKLDESEIPVCVYFTKHKEWWFWADGSFASDADHTTRCWPVHSAPEWVWGALKIEKKDCLRDWANKLSSEQLKTVVVDLVEALILAETVSFYEDTPVPYWKHSGDPIVKGQSA